MFIENLSNFESVFSLSTTREYTLVILIYTLPKQCTTQNKRETQALA